MTDVIFTRPFQRRLKALSKRYRSIKKDIQPIIDELAAGNFIGDQLSGVPITAFKVRSKNRDIPVGKSGGYRIIYRIRSPECISLLLIYSKSDQTDASVQEITEAIRQALEE